MGYNVPPGVSDATVPNPIFNLTPAATVDEGNNWINISWGPLAETNPATGATLGNYSLTLGSSAINLIPTNAGIYYTDAPSLDFFGNPRKTTVDPKVDAGAVEFIPSTTAVANVTGGPLLAFGNVAVGATSPAQTLTLQNTGGGTLTGITVVVTAPFAQLGGTCGTTLTPAQASCTITVVFKPTAAVASTGTATITGSVTVSNGVVNLTGTGTAPAAVANVSGGPLTFPTNVPVGTTTTARTLTLHNTGTANLTGITLAFSSPRYTRPTGTAGGTCGVTLTPAAATCTINVVFTPTAAGPVPATLTITDSNTPAVVVTGSPVSLTGTGVAAVASASLAPPTWTATGTTTHGTNGPIQIFTLTNTGTVTLTGIGQGALGGTNSADYTIVRAASTCGPAGNGQFLGSTTLAPAAACTVTVRFTPVTAGAKSATVSVTDAAGTQTSTMTGTAN